MAKKVPGWVEQVAQEKQRASRRAGDSPEKAQRYAQEVRDGHVKRAAEKGGQR